MAEKSVGGRQQKRRKPKKHNYIQWLRQWKKVESPCWPAYRVLMVVNWTDATFSDDDHGRISCDSAGWLKKADEHEIVLALEFFEDGETRSHLTVPAKMVNAVGTIGILDGLRIRT